VSRTSAVELLAEALHAEPEDVPADAALANTEGWDSLAHMRLIVALEERLGRVLDSEEVVRLTTLADVAALLDAGQ